MPRALIAVIGDTHMEEGGEKWNLTVAMGRQLVDEGYRIVTGGLGDLPSAIARGARSSPKYREGDLVAILPGFDPKTAGDSADIVIATGLDHARNAIIANSDAIVAVGGGSGALSEMALAWSLKRPVIACRVSGWSGQLAGTTIDLRERQQGVEDRVHPASSADEVSALLHDLLPRYPQRHRGIAVKDDHWQPATER